MMINWTSEQLEIIEDRKKNLIVSAAAGSGKTAVLIERIFRLLRNKDVSIKNILMITYTIKAAREMKEKLQNKLEEYILENYDEHLEKELRNLEVADIRTIDSFCNQVVKENYSYLDLDIKFQILDDYNKKIIEEKALDILFEEEYKNRNEMFLKNVKTYSNLKSDKSFREIILEIYRFSRSNADPHLWLDEGVPTYFNGIDYFKDSKLGKFYLENIVEKEFDKIDKFLTLMAKNIEEGAIEYLPNYEDDFLLWEEKKKEFTSGKIAEFYSGITKLSTLKRVKADKKAYYHEDFKKYRKKFKALVNDLLKKDIGSRIDISNKSRVEVIYIVDMVKRFGSILLDLKREENTFDFNDIEHFALSILEDNNIRKEYQNYYKYVFVDEYQDSNSLQERIFSLVMNKNNIFYVGDMKQSIYRFRQADSSIFLKTIDRYKDDENSRSLTLNKNFRSSSNIISGVNSVFNYLMDGNISPVRYREEAQLVCGLDININSKIETYVIDNFKKYSDLDADLIPREKSIQEAIICAERIRSLVDEGRYQYKDFVILGNSVKLVFNDYRKVFDSYGIPLYGEEDTKFVDSLMVQLIVDYLDIINNMYNDIALINVLKSKIYGLSLEELGIIRSFDENKYENNFLESIKTYLDKEVIDEDIKGKLNTFFNDIDYFKDILNSNNLVDFIIKVIINTNLYFLIFNREEYMEEKINVNELLRLAGSYEENNQDHLKGFLKYFKEGKKKELTLDATSLHSEKGNVVRMQTIHKSKGLEYRNVFLIKLGDKIIYNKSGGLIYHSNLGLGPIYLNEDKNEKSNTLANKIISKAKEYESIEDNYNLLYVAMTRAKENLFLIGTIDDFNDKKEAIKEKFYSKEKPINLYDMLLPFILEVEEVSKNYDLIYVDKPNNIISSKRKVKIDFSEEEKTIDIKRREIEHIPKKLTATDFVEVDSINMALTRDLLKGELKIKPDFLEEGKISSVEKGILFHLTMELLDFDREYDENVLEDGLANLVSAGILKSKEKMALDFKGLLGFFESDIYRRLREADYFDKEKAFNILINPRMFHEDYKGNDSILVQGIIDLYFVEGNKGILVDYKTDYVDEGNEEEKIEHYKKQLFLYKEALSRIKNLQVDEAYLYFSRNKNFVKVDLEV